MRFLATALIFISFATAAFSAESVVAERVKWSLWMEGVSDHQLTPSPRKDAPKAVLVEEIQVALDKFGL